MARHRRIVKPFPTFNQMGPIDPDEFNTALSWAMNAASKRAQITNPTKLGVNIDLGGNIERISFTDIPLNRALVALKERYGDNTDKFFNISNRIFAFFHIMKDPAMALYIKKGVELTEVHPAVTDAAAEVMLDSEGNFPPDIFFSKVKELAATKYKAEE